MDASIGAQIMPTSLLFPRHISQLSIGLNVVLSMPSQTMSSVKIERAFVVDRYPINVLSMLGASITPYLIFGVGQCY